jgi:peptidyl-prolyl cis-trans isomerase C
MQKLIKDPLVHFLLIGLALFAVAAWRGQTVSAGREEIVITAEQVAQARTAAAVLQGREPTPDELAALIEPTVRDEVMYREALALGLDENDDEVRRRLIEKMSYLTQDLADPEPPSEQALREFYAANAATFTTPALVSFDQVFFSPATRGETLEADAAAGLAALRAGRAAAEVGDRTPLRESYDDAPREQVAVLFGDALADALFGAPPGDWTGPFRSDFGLHVVRLNRRSEARLPPYDEIAARVAEEYGAQRRREANERAYREMRARYNVVIEQPGAAAELPEASAPAPAQAESGTPR